MKLTEKERRAVEGLRRLDAKQFDGVLAYVRRQALANEIVSKIARVKRLRIAPDRKIERAFGAARPRSGKR